MARVRNLIDSHRRLKQFFGDGQALAKEDVCDMDKEFVEKFKALIDEKMGDSGLNVEDLGKDMGLSRVQLYRKIKSLTNYSPNELLRIARLKKAASLLASSDMCRRLVMKSVSVPLLILPNVIKNCLGRARQIY